MTTEVKTFLPVILLGSALTGWLCTSSAYGTIEAAVGSDSTPDIIATIQRWGVVLTIVATLVGALAGRAIAGYWSLRRLWDTEREKGEKITATQEIHDDQIKQVNAALRNPVPSIPPPAEKIQSGIRPLTTTADIDHKTIGTP